MPVRPLTPCAQPGCPRLVERGRCGVHAHKRESRDHAGVAPSRRGYDRTYQRQRAAQIAAVPWCQCRDCPDHHGQECGARSNLTADHVVPLSRGGHPHGRLRTMCKSCANRQGGRLAAGWVTWQGRELIALMGAPGSGKTTWARSTGLPIVSTDTLRAAHVRGSFSTSMAGDVYARAADAIARALKANKRVVFDSVLANPKVRANLLGMARALHATATLVVFDTDLDVCIERQAGRKEPAPDAVVQDIHASLVAQHLLLDDEGWTRVVRLPGGGMGVRSSRPEPTSTALAARNQSVRLTRSGVA